MLTKKFLDAKSYELEKDQDKICYEKDKILFQYIDQLEQQINTLQKEIEHINDFQIRHGKNFAEMYRFYTKLKGAMK